MDFQALLNLVPTIYESHFRGFEFGRVAWLDVTHFRVPEHIRDISAIGQKSLQIRAILKELCCLRYIRLVQGYRKMTEERMIKCDKVC